VEAVAVPIQVAVIADAITIEIGPFGGVVGKRVLGIGAAIAVAVVVYAVGNAVTIQIRRHTAGVVGIRAHLFFMDVGDAVAVAVRIAVVANAVTVEIGPLI